MTQSLMVQHDRRGSTWDGNISKIKKIGPDTWSAFWENQNHDLKIMITDRAANKIEIWELEPEQHWTGTYTEDGEYYEAKGNLPPDRTFDAILVLPARAE